MSTGINRQDELLSKLKNCVGSMMVNPKESFKTQKFMAPITNSTNKDVFYNSQLQSRKQYQVKQNNNKSLSKITSTPRYENLNNTKYYRDCKKYSQEKAPENRVVLQEKKVHNYQDNRIYEKKRQTSYINQKQNNQLLSELDLKLNNKSIHHDVKKQIYTRYQSGRVNDRQLSQKKYLEQYIDKRIHLKPEQQNYSCRKQIDYNNVDSLTARKIRKQQDVSGAFRLDNYRKLNKVQSATRNYNSVLHKESIPNHTSKQYDYTKTEMKQYKHQKKEECSALEKLRRISELNSKINDRIRNIIIVFEQHKC